jgi:hypothetical protein
LIFFNAASALVVSVLFRAVVFCAGFITGTCTVKTAR